MNKYQEALYEVSSFIRNNSEVVDGCFRGQYALSILQELVDKETPTKTSKSHCGKCNIGYLVKSRGDKYCHVCGYKIDWSDDD